MVLECVQSGCGSWSQGLGLSSEGKETENGHQKWSRRLLGQMKTVAGTQRTSQFKLCFGQDIWTFRPLQMSLLKKAILSDIMKALKEQEASKRFFFSFFNVAIFGTKLSKWSCKSNIDSDYIAASSKIKDIENIFPYLKKKMQYFFLRCLTMLLPLKTNINGMSTLLYWTAHSEEHSFWLCVPRREIRHRETDNGHTNKSPSKKIPGEKASV